MNRLCSYVVKISCLISFFLFYLLPSSAITNVCQEVSFFLSISLASVHLVCVLACVVFVFGFVLFNFFFLSFSLSLACASVLSFALVLISQYSQSFLNHFSFDSGSCSSQSDFRFLLDWIVY